MRAFEHLFSKKILAIFGIVLVGILSAYLYSFSGAPEESSSLSSLPVSSLDGVLGRDLLAALAELKSTKLDTAIFDDPIFESFQDFSVEIAPLPVGRRNPFAPFEDASKAKGGSAKKTPPSSGGATVKPTTPKGATVEGFDVEP